jgi:hypothetical protein
VAVFLCQFEEDGVSLTIYAYARNEALYAVLALAAAFLKRGDLLIEEYGQISSRLQTPQD